MQDLENNNWIILDPLGNTYEIYANLSVMNLLKLNHFLIRLAESCLNDTFVKERFMFITILFHIYENTMRKALESYCKKLQNAMLF